MRGLWYVGVMKSGTERARTNYEAWQGYTPSVTWLTQLWDSNKLSHEQYLALSVRFRSGHRKRKRDFLEIQRDDYATTLKQHVVSERAAVLRRQPLQAWRHFPELDTYVIKSFHEPEWRRPPADRVCVSFSVH